MRIFGQAFPLQICFSTVKEAWILLLICYIIPHKRWYKSTFKRSFVFFVGFSFCSLLISLLFQVLGIFLWCVTLSAKKDAEPLWYQVQSWLLFLLCKYQLLWDSSWFVALSWSCLAPCRSGDLVPKTRCLVLLLCLEHLSSFFLLLPGSQGKGSLPLPPFSNLPQGYLWWVA